jgi:hypothetical protein
MTDIVLDDNGGNWITVDAGVVRTTATDVMIDNLARRGAATSPHRRALVHDMTDGLTVNFANDYTGGLTLNGVVRVTPREQKASGPIDPHLEPQIPQLVIEGGVQFVWNDGWDSLSVKHRTREVNLQALIEALQTEVADLRSRLEALGG